MISYIISHHNRPKELLCCLTSLRLQESPREVLVCDNSSDEHNRELCQMTCKISGVGGLKYLDTWRGKESNTCYHDPACLGAMGDWLCFPSDDSYYVPMFSRIMLHAAAEHSWEFVHCDMLYDPRYAHATRGVEGEYSVMITRPALGGIDKTCFLITRGAFDAVGGWPQHDADWRDGALAEAVVRAGIRHGRVPGPMVVHS